NDRYGHKLLKRFAEMGLPRNLVQIDKTAPTRTAAVSLAGNGIPRFTIQENVAWDKLTAPGAAVGGVREADAVCSGSLAQRPEPPGRSIHRLIAGARSQSLRVFDINLRQGFYSREVIGQSLRLANGLKLNEDELVVLAKMFGFAKSLHEQIEQLTRDFTLRLVALTRGPKGSLLYQEGRWSEQQPKPVHVVDTVGAGDAFAAALVMALLLRQDLDQVHAAAAELARYVCSRAGATPIVPGKF